jgi:hypothetical protein
MVVQEEALVARPVGSLALVVGSLAVDSLAVPLADSPVPGRRKGQASRRSTKHSRVFFASNSSTFFCGKAYIFFMSLTLSK